MAQRKNTPSKEQILSAWWNFPKDSNGWDLLQQKTHGKVRLDPQTDRCWNCRGLENSDWYPNIESIERCHIIANSLDGGNDPLNFVLLCSRCHRHSPDVKNSHSIFEWMEHKYDLNKEYNEHFISNLQTTFPEFFVSNQGIEKSIFYAILIWRILRNKRFIDFESKNTTWHFGIQTKASTRVHVMRQFVNQHGILQVKFLKKLWALTFPDKTNPFVYDHSSKN